jgi:hypothetical protein
MLTKYLDKIDRHQTQVLSAISRSRELVKAFGDDIPYPSDEELEKYKNEVWENLKNASPYDNEIGHAFITYRALMNYVAERSV